MQKWQERIVIDPEIRFGKAIIKGSRISVDDILGWLASDMSNKEIIEDFPKITHDDILAALAFASKRGENTRVLISG